jgi:transposase
MRISIGKVTAKRLEQERKKAELLNNLRLYKIIWCLLLIHKGKSVESIAELLDVSGRTVYNWLFRFMVEGFPWLLGHHFQGRGRKPKLNKEQREKLFKIVEDGPEKHGFDCGIWNSAMIVEVIQREFHVTYNPRYLCELLSKMNLSYQKCAFVAAIADDEEHQRKRKEWVEKTWPEILQRAKSMGAVIVFVDEVSFAQWGSLARTWAPRGKQPTIKTCGKRKGLKMFGAIEFKSGAFHYVECDGKFHGEFYIECLRSLMARFSCPIILIEDGASYHWSKPVNEFKKEVASQELLFSYKLPPYSPDKNPIEKLWRKTKRDATHCKYFPTFEHLRSAVLNAFKKYMENATKVISTMKKLRTEAGLV